MHLVDSLRRLARVARSLAASEPLQPREGYALWANTYPPRPHNRLMEAEQAIVQPIIDAAMPTCALDVGTGTGRYLGLLKSAGAARVVGLDMSLAMLGRTSCEAARVCGDARRLPFRDASFDLVCSSLMVGDLVDLGAWVREATRVLAPGGHLIYSDFHPSWAARRWRRTFRDDAGRRRELAYFPHQIEEHLAVLEASPLAVRAIREPRIPERPAPVVVVFHAVRPGIRAWLQWSEALRQTQGEALRQAQGKAS
jgi:SAM-dependent methyltransferase